MRLEVSGSSSGGNRLEDRDEVMVGLVLGVVDGSEVADVAGGGRGAGVQQHEQHLAVIGPGGVVQWGQ